MHSISKIQLSSDIAQNIAAAHFGEQARLCAFTELEEGYFNAAALLELEDGLKCVLKAAPPDSLRAHRDLGDQAGQQPEGRDLGGQGRKEDP